MTKLEDEISSVQTLRHMTLVLLIMSEIASLIRAYKWNVNPGLHFNLNLFGLPLIAAAPYLASLQGQRLIKRLSNVEMELPTQLALSRQISVGAIAAYGLFVVALAAADLK